ncbi:MAG: glutamate--tRNA ligase [Candidatus Gracilibacteria bacterium]|nr:glutamate--tRNA ligase [Candidatus Gracilibacteria bacterium]
MTIVTRFAPSPTGYLHIGSLRTVLYNYLYAKQNKGKFLLRIEDTDRTRLVEGSVENMIEVLTSVGLTPDEGPNRIGDVGPYYQSERLEIYKKYIDQLLKNDKAYYCFCSGDRLTELREEQTSLGLPTKYDKHCRYLSDDELKEKLDSKAPYTVRLKVPEGQKVIFQDTVKGKIEVDTKDIDEQVLLKSDGFPTYHMANVIDDHLMGVTHVIRGDEWTPSAPKHVLLYNAFGWDHPTFSHIPLLMATGGKKLSKRTGDVSVEIYLEKGYLVEAIINYIALLGWNPKTTEEFFSMDELIQRFNIDHVNKSGAIFDVERLNFFNAHYLKTKNVDEVYFSLMKYLEKYDNDFFLTLQKSPEEYNKNILNELKSRIKKFDEFKDLTYFFYNEVQSPENELYLNQKMKITDIEDVKKALLLTQKVLEDSTHSLDSVEEIKNVFIVAIKAAEMKNGQVLWPARVALSGEEFSPGALEMIFLLGREESLIRIKQAIINIK